MLTEAAFFPPIDSIKFSHHLLTTKSPEAVKYIHAPHSKVMESRLTSFAGEEDQPKPHMSYYCLLDLAKDHGMVILSIDSGSLFVLQFRVPSGQAQSWDSSYKFSGLKASAVESRELEVVSSQYGRP